MKWDIQYVIVLITSIFCFLIAIPLIVYHGYEYYQNRNLEEYKKRYAIITVYEVIFAIIKFLFSAFGMLTMFLQQVNLSAVQWGFISEMLAAIGNIAWYCVILCWTIRFFLLSFNLNFSNILSHNNQWKKIINPKVDTTQNAKMQWYLNKKSKYNNVLWVAALFSPLFVLAAICDFIDVVHFVPTIQISRQTQLIIDLIDATLFIILYAPIFCIYFTIPKFKDNFFITGELHRIFIAFFIWSVVYIMEVLLSYIQFQNKILTNMLMALSFFIVFASDFAIVLISTCWVNQKLLFLIQQKRLRKTRSVSKDYSYWVLNESASYDKQQKKQNNDMNKIEIATSTLQFLDIVSNEDKFEYFVDYITKDLSLKQLLAFIELNQFKEYALSPNLNEYEEKQDLYKQKIEPQYQVKKIKFHPNIIKSYIVFHFQPKYSDEMNEIDVLKSKGRELFLKYIEYGSNYEVDIDTNVRLHIINLMEHEDYFMDDYETNKHKLAHLFDNVVDDLWESLISTFIRFKYSKQYSKLIHSNVN